METYLETSYNTASWNRENIFCKDIMKYLQTKKIIARESFGRVLSLDVI